MPESRCMVTGSSAESAASPVGLCTRENVYFQHAELYYLPCTEDLPRQQVQAHPTLRVFGGVRALQGIQ
jgi:hypothetical protein